MSFDDLANLLAPPGHYRSPNANPAEATNGEFATTPSPLPKQVLSLAKLDANATPGVSERSHAEEELKVLTKRIAELQGHLFVNGSRAILVVLQGMDASGKDGVIRKVFAGVNPAGVQVTSFKRPSAEERAHDFLWRIHAATPAHGYIGVFNRSHYEDCGVVRVNADAILNPQEKAQLPDLWNWRYSLIRNFERMLVKSGTVVLKFYLHIDKDEQRKRLQARQDEPEKHWKLEWQDFAERKHWEKYMEVYSETIQATHMPGEAPWFVIPANHKWYRNWAIATILANTLDGLHLPPPEVNDPELLKLKIK